MDRPNQPPGGDSNPATRPESTAAPSPQRRRIPMSVPRQKLQTSDIPGYHLYWFLESKVPMALQAGYEFVDEREVVLNQTSVGSDSAIAGNADLGSRLKVVAGVGRDNQPEHHVLMKIRLEWFKEDQKLLEQRNADILSAIFKGEEIMGSENVPEADKSLRYVDRDRTSIQRPLFQRPVRKSR